MTRSDGNTGEGTLQKERLTKTMLDIKSEQKQLLTDR